MLTSAEHNEFHLVVENAKAEGWLDAGVTLSATPVDTAVLIQCTRDGQVVRQARYPHDARWPFALLRDLAHGLWRDEAVTAE